MPQVPFWTEERLKEAFDLACKVGCPKAAVELSARWGIDLRRSAIQNAFQRVGWHVPHQNKAKPKPPQPPHPPAPPPDPLDFKIEVEPLPPLPPLEAAQKAHVEQRTQRDLRAEHRALLDENDRLKAELSAATELRARAPEILVYRESAEERSDAVACAVASDWHVEEPVDGATVHGLNEYNLEIAQSRAEHFFKNTLRLANMMARDSKISTIYLAALGDFFSGYIHDELAANNLLGPRDGAEFCKSLIVSGINYWLKESDFKIDGDAIVGNHGRMTKKMWFGDPVGTSLEAFMYSAIADHFHAEPRVNIRVASQAMIYRRFFESFDLRLIHGYEVKFNGGVGGITIPLNKAIGQWDKAKRASLTVLGHYHTFFDGGRFLVNGSLIGYNTFAQAIKADFEEAKQAFFLVHARKGGEKTGVFPVWLDSER